MLHKKDPSYAHSDDLIRCRFGAQSLKNFPRIDAKSTERGMNRSKFKGRGMDFSEVRNYQPGDDARHIDWRVTAKTQKPHTKIFSEEKEKPIHIITDIRPNMFFGRDTLKSVSACYIAATLAWACIKNDDRAGGIIFGPNDHKEIKPKKSSRSVLQIINALQTFSETLAKAYTEGNLTDDTYSLTKMLSEARRIISPGCSIFIISDFMDLNDQCDQYLFELAKIGSINFCHIFDSFEQKLPKDRSLRVGNSDRQINLDTRDRLMRVKHEQLFKYRLDKLNEMRTKLNAELLSFETNHDYLNTLMLHYGGGKNRNKRRPSFAN